MKIKNIIIMLVGVVFAAVLQAQENNQSLYIQELTSNDVDYLGTSDESLLVNGMVRERIAHHPRRLGSDYFSVTDVTWEFSNAYQRFVRAGVELITQPTTITVEKSRDGLGSFPTVAAKKVTLYFDRMFDSTKREIKILMNNLKSVAPETKISLTGATLTIEFPGLFEFDFAPHNFGCYIAKLSRVSQSEKIKTLEEKLADIIKDPILGKNWDLTALSHDELNQLSVAEKSVLQQVDIVQDVPEYILPFFKEMYEYVLPFSKYVYGNFLTFSRYGELFKAKIIASLDDGKQQIISVDNNFYALKEKSINGLNTSVLLPIQDITSHVSRVYNSSEEGRVLKDAGNVKCYSLKDGDKKRYIIPLLVGLRGWENHSFMRSEESKKFVMFLHAHKNSLAEVEAEFRTTSADKESSQMLSVTAKDKSGEQISISLPITYPEKRDDSTDYLKAENADLEITFSSYSNTVVLSNGLSFRGDFTSSYYDRPRENLPRIDFKILAIDDL